MVGLGDGGGFVGSWASCAWTRKVKKLGKGEIEKITQQGAPNTGDGGKVVWRRFRELMGGWKG